VTTHAGSLPRPGDLANMVWSRALGNPVDESALEARLDSAVAEVVARQRAIGIDVINDGEYSKSGFNLYIKERFDGFGGRAEFELDDVKDFPELTARIFPIEALAENPMETCLAPVTTRDERATRVDAERLLGAIGRERGGDAFLGSVSPGQIAFNFPNRYYKSHEEYLAALVRVLAPEYRMIVDAGLNLQIDSPDLAMAAHCRFVGSSIEDWAAHLPLAIEALNEALREIPRERVRLHVCWGNYGGPHDKDVELKDIARDVLKAHVGYLSTEGGNPRHQHEWRVWDEVALPDEMSLILGVIDVRTNYVEHPRVVADRLVRVANVVGKERVVAGTDCGFESMIGHTSVHPEVAWLKLRSLVEGAALASEEL
jgi:5-methyltetrahydropteroyltriglutamate--homocysteine methyltransferase